MVVVLIARHHACRHLLAHVAHLTVDDQQCILLHLNSRLKRRDLLGGLIKVLHHYVHRGFGIVADRQRGTRLLNQLLDVLEQNVVTDIVR